MGAVGSEGDVDMKLRRSLCLGQLVSTNRRGKTPCAWHLNKGRRLQRALALHWLEPLQLVLWARALLCSQHTGTPSTLTPVPTGAHLPAPRSGLA